MSFLTLEMFSTSVLSILMHNITVKIDFWGLNAKNTSKIIHRGGKNIWKHAID